MVQSLYVAFGAGLLSDVLEALLTLQETSIPAVGSYLELG